MPGSLEESIILRVSFAGGAMDRGEELICQNGQFVTVPHYGAFVPGGDDAFVRLSDRTEWMLLAPTHTAWWPQGPEWFSGTISGNRFRSANGGDVFELDGWDYPGDPGGCYVFRQLWHKEAGLPRAVDVDASGAAGRSGMRQIRLPAQSPTGVCRPILTDALLRAAIERADEIQREIKELLALGSAQAASMLDPTGLSSMALSGYDFHRGDLVGGCLNLVGAIPLLGEYFGRMPATATLVGRLAGISRRLDRLLKAIAEAETVKQTVPTLSGALSYLGKGQRNVARLVTEKLNACRRQSLAELEQACSAGGASRDGIERIMSGLPTLRNPRLLGKHGEGYAIESLNQELRAKGFVKVKSGNHTIRTEGENSDVWVRRVLGNDGHEYWEFVRQDIRRNVHPDGTPVNLTRPLDQQSASQRQMSGRRARQGHLWADHPSTPETLGQRAGMINDGLLYKGDFTHWHHVLVKADPGNLSKMLDFQASRTITTPIIDLDMSGRTIGQPGVKSGLSPLGR